MGKCVLCEVSIVPLPFLVTDDALVTCGNCHCDDGSGSGFLDFQFHLLD